MAILQIARIQSRRGLQENLPQLASAELGWALDTRRLYIGNGELAEGAPTVGVTELLTEHSNITSLANAYTFAGIVGNGAPVNTSPIGSLAQVTRSIRDALDDNPNIRDFVTDAVSTIGDGLLHGAHTGIAHNINDGIENPVDYINRAITELYKVTDASKREERTLKIPAGIYILWGDFIRLLPGVRLLGDGKGSTIIIQMDPSQPCVVSSCDSTYVTGFAYLEGTSSPNPGVGHTTVFAGTAPGNLNIEGMTFVNSVSNDVVYFDSVTNVLFNKVAMLGNTSVISSNACVKFGALTTGSQTLSSNIAFDNCDFSGDKYAIYADNNVTNVTVDGSVLTNLQDAIMLASTSSNANISSVKITCSMFDQVANAAIKSNNVSHVVSAFNTFKTVGEVPQVAIVDLNGNSCYSIGDMFDRPANAAVQAVSIHGKSSFAAMDNGKLLLGAQVTAAGNDIVLAANVSIATSGNIGVIGYGVNATIVEYAITRNADKRIGSINISNDGTNVVYSDNYVQSNDVGITLTPVLANGLVELQFTATPGNTATVKTASRTFI